MHTNIQKALLWGKTNSMTLIAIGCGLTCGTVFPFGTGEMDAYLLHRLPGGSLASTPAVARPVPLSRVRPLSLRSASASSASFSASSSAHNPRAPLRDTLHAGPVRIAENTAVAAESATTATPFPPLDHALFPVWRVPNWGAMTSAVQWDRTDAEMTTLDLVPVPSYDLSKLTVPLESLRSPRNIPELTRKLVYSTRYFGSYDLDSGEFTGIHSGIDLKLALGAAVGAIGGGRVQSVAMNDALGLHVIIEHRTADGTFFSIYGHLASTPLHAGDDVRPGQTVGIIGMTGNTSGPHLHLQVDRDDGSSPHVPYAPLVAPTREEAAKRSISPIEFIGRFGGGE